MGDERRRPDGQPPAKYLLFRGRTLVPGIKKGGGILGTAMLNDWHRSPNRR
jgi:hypothetical protein